jgi:hypothetical protein
MALAQFGTRFKIGFHHAQLIEYFLDRATNPTFEKLASHYPEHPRPGAPELHPGSDFGKCIINALNIKRGYWRLPRAANSNQAPSGISPFGSTPESVGQASGSGSSGTSTAVGSGSGPGANYNDNKYGRGDDNPPDKHPNPFITGIVYGESNISRVGKGQGESMNMNMSDTSAVPFLQSGVGQREGEGQSFGPASSVYAWSITNAQLMNPAEAQAGTGLGVSFPPAGSRREQERAGGKHSAFF